MRVKFNQFNPTAPTGEYTATLRLWNVDENGNLLSIVSEDTYVSLILVDTICEDLSINSQLTDASCSDTNDGQIVLSGFGGLDVVVYSAEDSSGILLGGKLLDYGFSIEAYGSELIIGGSFETSTTSFGLSATDEEDGFVASIDLSGAEFTINWANGVGGLGIDLVTSTAINSENNNVYVSAMVTESGKAGSIDYPVYDSQHLVTKVIQ